MSSALPSPRAIGRALAVLQALPPAALAALAERLIDRLDAAAPHEAGNHWPPTKGAVDCGPVPLLLNVALDTL